VPDIVRESLGHFGYAPVMINAEQTDFRFEIRTESNQKWRAQLTLAPPSVVIQFIVHCSTPYPTALRAQVAELTQRVDEKIGCLGGFGFHWPSGSPFLRYGVDYEGQALSVAAISRQMNATAWPLKVYQTAFGLMDLPKLTPEKAVDIALLLHDCAEEVSHPHEALKTILTVEHGGGNGDGKSRAHISLFDL
jgi:hypothetical protein